MQDLELGIVFKLLYYEIKPNIICFITDHNESNHYILCFNLNNSKNVMLSRWTEWWSASGNSEKRLPYRKLQLDTSMFAVCSRCANNRRTASISLSATVSSELWILLTRCSYDSI